MVAGASPALVSSLLIRSDQLRRSMFGFRSASSTLAAQWSILRFVVQLSYRSSFAALRFAARSPSSQRAGLDSGCAGKKTYPWVGDYFLGAPKSHLATRAFSPFATTISPSACPIHAAADLMTPSFRRGQFKTETPHAMLWFCPYSNGHEPLFFLAVLRLTEGHLAVRIHSMWLPGYWRPRIKAASHDSSICYPG